MANDVKLLAETLDTMYQNTREEGTQISNSLRLVPTTESGNNVYEIWYRNAHGDHQTGTVTFQGRTAYLHQVITGGGSSGSIQNVILSSELGKLRLSNKILEMLLQDCAERDL